MMQERVLLTLGLVISSLNLLSGVPLALRLIGINRFYGWRTEATLHSSKLWYEINSRLGWGLTLAGVFGIALYLLLKFDVILVKPSAKGVLLLSTEGIATLLVTLVVGWSIGDS